MLERIPCPRSSVPSGTSVIKSLLPGPFLECRMKLLILTLSTVVFPICDGVKINAIGSLFGDNCVKKAAEILVEASV